MAFDYNDEYNEEYNDYQTITKRPRRRWLEILLLTGFIGCLLIGLAALTVLFARYRTTRPNLTDDPLHAIQTDQIVPQLALMQLAGDPADALAFQAINAGELETSRAMITFEPSTAPSRIGLLLQLAHHYLTQKQPLAAAQIYRLVRATAILDFAPGSFERSQALVQCSEGMLAANERAAALDSIAQAKRVAEQSPDLLPAQRSQIFTSLRPLASQLDNATLTHEIEDLARNPFLKPTGVLLTSQWSTLATPLTFAPNLTIAINTRHQRARELAQRILVTKGTDIDPERQALAQALVQEDQLRLEYTNSRLTTGLSLSQQVWLLQEQRAWLLLKTRVALLGFGLSLVPEWENTSAVLLQELATATRRLGDVVTATANAQTKPLDKAMLNLEAIQWLALQAELGLYPNATLTDIEAKLQATLAELNRLGSAPALPVAYTPEATPPGFRIQPVNQ